MLHTSTVDPRTFSLLKELMVIPSLQDANLVGGTALALRYGHRISVDLDLFFSDYKPDFELIQNQLEQKFGNNFVFDKSYSSIGLFCYIYDIKVDIVYFPFNRIAEIEVAENIRIYSDFDISAMKIYAILKRGQKKDFWDLFELLKVYSVKQIFECYEKKFPNNQMLISIPNAITYFDDAEQTQDPISLKGQTWESVKDFIRLKVREYLT